MLLLSSLAGQIPASEIPTIQPFALVYPITFIINLILFTYWIFRGHIFAAFSGIIFIFSVGNITHNFPVSLFTKFQTESSDIKVLSYNVRNFNERESKGSVTSKNNIISFLSDETPDLVCIQEYHSTSNNLYEPLKSIRDKLGMESYYYESYFNPKHNQLLGIVTFSKYRAINKGKLKFQGTRTFGIYTDVIINLDTVRVFNIHLASIKLLPSDLDFVTNQESENSEKVKGRSIYIYNKLIEAFKLREKQLNKLIEIIDNTPYAIILCGDFNDTPSSWVYRQMNNKLEDTFVEKGTGICPTYAGPIPFLRIDYIFKSKDYKTRGIKRYTNFNSDHYPISAILKKY